SRRRHTRSKRDWSSDVCSSDLSSWSTSTASAASVEAIAQRAGVSTRTFFNHWTTKESAIIGVLMQSGEGIAEQLRERIEESGPRSEERRVGKEGRSGGGQREER